MKDWNDFAQKLIAAMGSAENINSFTHCIIRLRFAVKDESAVDIGAVQKLDGVVKAFFSGGQCQICIGNRVKDAYQAVVALPGMELKARA